MADFEKDIELDPNIAKGYLGHGDAMLQDDDFSAAVAEFSRGIEIDPRNCQTDYRRGSAYSIMGGEQEKAVDDFNKALELSDDTYWQRQPNVELRKIQCWTGRETLTFDAYVCKLGS